MSTIGFSAINTQAATLQARDNSFIQKAQSGQAAHDDSKIDKSSKEFESLLLEGWMQQAEHSFATVPGSEEDGDDQQRDQIMSFGVQALAKAMVQSGGIGIAKMISTSLHAAADRENGQAVRTTGTESKNKQE